MTAAFDTFCDCGTDCGYEALLLALDTPAAYDPAGLRCCECDARLTEADVYAGCCPACGNYPAPF